MNDDAAKLLALGCPPGAGGELPPEDRTLSPYTGFTRAHWEATADGLLSAAWRWATPRGALLDLPGPPSRSGVRSDGLEGYARTFLAAAFRVAGADGGDPHGWLGRYADGLDAGTRTPGRDDAESWPVIRHHDVFGQPMVESASVALGLRLTRPWLWDKLDSATQDRAEAWLRAALHSRPAPNNWYLFPYTVAAFLESVGRGDAATAAALTRAEELLETWYVGQGWYTDGDGRAFDHYNGWALHLYPVLHAHLGGDGERAARYGGRLREHLDSFALMFASDGAPLHYGRSLTYRFGTTAAVAAGALTGHTPLTPGASRRVLSGSLRYFLERGAADADGLLTLGWHGPHAATLQRYSGPSSPYWASKAFVALLAGQDHPLWTAVEEPAPSEGADRALALPGPGLLLHSTRDDGVVRLHNHGSDRLRPHEGENPGDADPHYGRFAYSTATGPTSASNPFDNHFSVETGGFSSVRRRIHPLGAGSGEGWGWAASWHTPVFTGGPAAYPGLRVESVTFVRGAYELRVHRVVGAPPGSVVRQTGWATAADGALLSELHPLRNWDERDEVRAPEGTAYTRWALVPRLTAAAGGTTLHAALARLGSAAARPQADVISRTSAGDDTFEALWWDGATTRIGFAGEVSVEHGTH
ncbi:DUF2264 domain-containing protein [Streptomyces sp. NBC_01497]|uniref:DUF2264 domain-containing protein n=1 Tax=Streptomyces sp. NBC_01497 TaxID=2903885 RepID=UPI002E3720AD|nr:DUF2264 domain-containing protein [Streptomyces sp. NBC_01497]